jgi:hypothetical protein
MGYQTLRRERPGSALTRFVTIDGLSRKRHLRSRMLYCGRCRSRLSGAGIMTNNPVTVAAKTNPQERIMNPHGQKRIMNTQRMQLHGLDRVIYFAPTLFTAYLAGMCGLLTFVAALFTTLPNPKPIIGVGMFGLGVTLGLCALLYRAQSRELRYQMLLTTRSAPQNYALLMHAAQEAGWTIAHCAQDELIEARVAGSLLTLGEMVVARFDGSSVLIAAISDPRIGYSMTGRERCRRHVELIRSKLESDETSIP